MKNNYSWQRFCFGLGARPVRAGSIGPSISEFGLRISEFYCFQSAVHIRQSAFQMPPPYPRRNMRLMIPSGPVWPPNPEIPWPGDTPFFKERKCYPTANFFHLNFSVLRAIRARKMVIIQKRTITFGSAHPFNSK